MTLVEVEAPRVTTDAGPMPSERDAATPTREVRHEYGVPIATEKKTTIFTVTVVQ